MYAIFRTGGKQFRAEPGKTIRVPSLDVEPGERVTFGEVLLGASDSDVKLGAPLVDGAAVTAEVVKHGKDAKIIVFKFKRRKNYRRKQGHRQKYTEVRVQDINLG
jgi:large subunit ribosomal protein L21